MSACDSDRRPSERASDRETARTRESETERESESERENRGGERTRARILSTCFCGCGATLTADAPVQQAAPIFKGYSRPFTHSITLKSSWRSTDLKTTGDREGLSSS